MPRRSSLPSGRSTDFTCTMRTPSARAASWKPSIGATTSRARGAGHGQAGSSSRWPRCMSIETTAVVFGSR